MLGRDGEDFSGASVDSMLEEASRLVFSGKWNGVLSGKSPARFLDLEFVAADGGRVFTDVFITRFDPGFEGVAMVQVLDVTRHKETGVRLAAAKRRLHLTAEIAGMGFWEYNFKTGTQDWDEGVFRIYGIRREDFSGRWDDYVHPEDHAEAERAVWDIVRSGTSGVQCFRVVRPDGITRHVQSIFTVERDAAGEPSLLTGINFDITDKLLAEQSARMKARFLAGVSHEIRTPLSALVNLSQSMVLESEKHSLPAEFTEHLESVRAGGQYLNLILTNLLDISAMESGHAPVRPETFYLRDWVDDVSAIIDPIARSRSVAIVWRVPADDNLRFTTDSVRLTQIFLNLSHNAVKFSLKPGSRVWISVVHDGESLQLSVADEGPGIDPDDLDALFEEFSQSETAGTSADRGAGLGLAVVRQNTGLLGGTLRTRPVKPTGICFEINLPDMGAPLQKPCAH